MLLAQQGKHRGVLCQVREAILETPHSLQPDLGLQCYDGHLVLASFGTGGALEAK